MSNDLGFDADELAQIRELFRDEAHAALEEVSSRALASRDQAIAPEALIDMMRTTHTLKGSAGTIGLAGLVSLVHRLESSLAAIHGGTMPWNRAAAELVVEISDGLIAFIDEPPDQQEARAEALSGLLALLGGSAARPGRERRPSEISDGDDDPGDRADASISLQPTPDPGEGPALLRVASDRIDALLAATGVLLFDRTRIERQAQLLRTLARELGQTRQALHGDLDELDRRGARDLAAPLHRHEAAFATQITRVAQTTAALVDETEALRRTISDLQRDLLRTRLQPARTLFAQLARSLRSLSRDAEVEVVLRTSGEDTELDRALADQLKDALLQLLRNALVHGIEPAAARVAAGKPRQGTVEISARAEGNLVVVEVKDDGRGIDARALRARLVETGYWSHERAEASSDDEVLAAIFDPGVSSRSEADDLAGRGVGLDLVREAVARFAGEIRVSSTPGRGTEFTLRMPVSSAVSQAMLFKVHGQTYAIPHVHVVAMTTVDAGASTAIERHQELPVLRLEQLLAAGGSPEPQRRPGLVLNYAGRELVCTVDKVIGHREVVLRPLGPLLASLPLYAGATISGSAKVQLVLDPAALAKLAHPDATSADGPVRAALVGRALVVDDSRAIREALTVMLSREGWIVDVAEDGLRAWDMACQLDYDLLITDLEMPRLSGFDLIQRIRDHHRLGKLAVVIVTSRTSPEVRRRARELAVRAVIGKPLTRRKLMEALAADERS